MLTSYLSIHCWFIYLIFFLCRLCFLFLVFIHYLFICYDSSARIYFYLAWIYLNGPPKTTKGQWYHRRCRPPWLKWCVRKAIQWRYIPPSTSRSTSTPSWNRRVGARWSSVRNRAIRNWILHRTSVTPNAMCRMEPQLLIPNPEAWYPNREWRRHPFLG